MEKKYYAIGLVLGIMYANGVFAADMQNITKAYNDFKQKLSDEAGITYSADISILGQRGSPGGKGTPWQTQYYGTANWDMFSSDKWGSGSAQISYTVVRYWGKNAQIINNNIGLVSSFNDYTLKSNYFDQLSYTHQFPNLLKAFSLTVGQFPMYNFDGGNYDANQQINFLNYALSQNGSSTYPSASLGGYLTFEPNSKWSVSAGFQDATNISGKSISTSHFGKGKYTPFATITYSPKIKGLGAGEYSILLYYQPSVDAQPGSNRGWSISLEQDISKKITLFGRINGTNGNQVDIKQSYVIGGVCNNPLNRNSLDQIGVALAVNKINQENVGTPSRRFENVIETYWAWGVSDFLTLTPDIQFYIHPGADPNNKTAVVSSVRATMMF